jgi:hypothetical protein
VPIPLLVVNVEFHAGMLWVLAFVFHSRILRVGGKCLQSALRRRPISGFEHPALQVRPQEVYCALSCLPRS